MRPVDALLVSGTTDIWLRSDCLHWVAQGRTEGASRYGAGPAMRNRLLYLILIANVLVVAGLGAKAVYDYRVFRTLNDEGRIASATVRDVRPAVRNRLASRGRWILDYSFTTAANATVDASISVPRDTAARFTAGQHIDVVYAPNDPSLTALNPEQAWAVVVYDEWVLVPYLATLMMLGWILLERRKSRGP